MRAWSWLPALVATLSLLTPWGEVNAAKPSCRDGEDFLRDSSNCSRFYRCVHGNAFLMPCPPGTVFSESEKNCVNANKVPACNPQAPAPTPTFTEDDLDFQDDDLSSNVASESNGGKKKLNPLVNSGLLTDIRGGNTGISNDIQDFVNPDTSSGNGQGKIKLRKKKGCGPMACKDYCPNGYVQDHNECNTCACVPPSFSADAFNRCSPPVQNSNGKRSKPCQNLLYNDCTFGYRLNADGCLTCECASARETMSEESEEKDVGVPFAVNVGDANKININDDNSQIPIPIPSVHPEPWCRGLPEGETKTAHPSICHRFFDCSKAAPGDARIRKGLAPYERECDYPLQFDAQRRRCRWFAKVSCGTRSQEADFCGYAKNMCGGGNCRPCASLHPSCRGLTDGTHAWPGRSGSGFHVECEAGRTVREALCERDEAGELMEFDEELRTCRPRQDSVATRCKWLQSQVTTPQEEMAFIEMGGLLTHPDCNSYYNCSAGGNHVASCPYPQLWDAGARRCRDFRAVGCGLRNEKKTPCEYKQCADPDWGSCAGMDDGDNVFRTREGTASYVTCLAGRTMASHTCGVDADGLYMHFSPTSRSCVSVTSTSHDGRGLVGRF